MVRYLLVAAFIAGWSALCISQDKTISTAKDTGEKDSKEIRKFHLPPNWGKLNLTDEQKGKCAKIWDKYEDEIGKLKMKIAELEEKHRKERYEVLTPDQKKSLEKIVRGKYGVE